MLDPITFVYGRPIFIHYPAAVTGPNLKAFGLVDEHSWHSG